MMPDRQPVGLRQVGGHEINAGLLKAEEEIRIARQAIELGNDQLGTDQPAELERCSQLWAICMLAALDLHELPHELPVATVEIVLNGPALRLDTKAALALARGGNPQI
jgi:hypothetical protein